MQKRPIGVIMNFTLGEYIMMKMKNNTKFIAVILMIAMAVTAAGGYAARPVNVSAKQVAGSETGNIEESGADIAEQEIEGGLSGKNVESVSDADLETTANETAGSTDETTSEEGTSEEPTTGDPEDPDAYTLIAHRGYSGYAPDNSMPAFEMAVASGFKAIELDIIRCKEDAQGKAVWVLSHDNSLKNTMGVDKKITDLTYEQILEYSYTKGNNVNSYNDLKIVSLEQIIDLIRQTKEDGSKIKWQIELKYADTDNYTDYFQDEVVTPVKEAQVEDCVVFSSFHYSYLNKIKSIDENLRTWYLSTILDNSAIDYAKKCDAEGISFKGNASSTTKQMIDSALGEGFSLGTYTINSTVLMGVYYQWGVRSFATDYLSPMEVTDEMLNGTYNVKLFTYTLSNDSYTYDGNKKQPSVKVIYKGISLIEGVNYELSYDKDKYPGTASVFISGINNCTDKKELNYKITMPKVTGFKITASKTTYIGLSWNKVKYATGYIVYRYNYTKKAYEAVKTINNPDTVTTKIEKLTSATKYRFRVKAYVEGEGKKYKSEPCTGKTTYTRPAKTKIRYSKRYHDYARLRIKWTRPRACTGYNIKISTDKKMKKVVGYYTVKGRKAYKLKIKKLKKNKKYYVKVRAYLKVGSTKYNGVYSPVIKSSGKPKTKK